MKHFVLAAAMVLASSTIVYGSDCGSSALTTYINGGSLFACTEDGGLITIEFNNTVLPSYTGLGVLSSGADPAAITVVPGSTSLDFDSDTFNANSIAASAQAELVHFSVFSNGPSLLSDTFSLHNPQVSAGNLIAGAGVAVGQELVCVGGTFTSLPAGLITSVTNGLLGTGNFGCDGAVLVGTAGDSAGPLDALSALTGLPDLTGLSDSATIQLSPVNPREIDVIKIQALLSVADGVASTTGFGDTFTAAPEPASFLLAGLALLCGAAKSRRSRLFSRPGRGRTAAASALPRQ